MLAKSPMQKEVKAAIAAVAVTRSLLISWTQSRYSVLVSHKSFLKSSGGQTQVPPLSDVIVAGISQ